MTTNYPRGRGETQKITPPGDGEWTSTIVGVGDTRFLLIMKNCPSISKVDPGTKERKIERENLVNIIGK